MSEHVRFLYYYMLKSQDARKWSLANRIQYREYLLKNYGIGDRIWKFMGDERKAKRKAYILKIKRALKNEANE